MRVYGLDRIIDLKITDKKFKMPKDFDVDRLFATSFGIYIPEAKAQTIVFRTTATEAKFVRDLPIHKSQRELGKSEVRRQVPEEDANSRNVYFEIFVCPNESLIMEFCKHGARLEIIAPDAVREAVAAELRRAALQYYEQQ